MNEIMNAISTLGFPIVCCGALFWYMIKQDERHKDETAKLTDAINNNTNIMTKLVERLGGEHNV